MELANKFSIIAIALILSISLAHGFDEVSIDRVINEFRTNHNAPGFGLTIYHEGEKLSKGYGVMRDPDIPVNPSGSTLFSIASITKLFTAILSVKILNEKFPDYGKGVLDVPIKKLMPDFNLVLIDKYRTDEVTFKDILSHRICIEPTDLFAVNYETSFEREDLIYRLRYAEGTCTFRNGAEYHNVLFLMAGELLSHLKETPFAQIMDGFLEEIGMMNSFVVRNTTKFDEMENMSSGFVFKGDERITFHPDLIKRIYLGQGGGGIITSPHDMGIFMEFFLNKGTNGNGVEIIPADVLEWVTTPVVPLGEYSSSSWDFSQFALALGTSLGVYKGFPRVINSGDWTPFLSRLDQFPDDKLAIFTVMNGPGYYAENSYTHEELHFQIYDILMGNVPKNIKTKPRNPTKRAPQFKEINPEYKNSTRTKNTDILGIYGHPIHAEVEIKLIDEKLRLEYGKWGHADLIEVSDTIYDINWDEPAKQLFYALGFDEIPRTYFNFTEDGNVQFHFLSGMVIKYENGMTVDKWPDKMWPDCVEEKSSSLKLIGNWMIMLITISISNLFLSLH